MIYALRATHVLLIIVPYWRRFVNTQVCKDPLESLSFSQSLGSAGGSPASS